MHADLAGQVGIIHSKQGWSPLIVRLVTHSYWSHVIVALDDELCVSAEPGGTVIRAIDSYRDVIWSRFDLDEDQRLLIIGWAARRVGTPYAWSDFYVAGITALLKSHTPKWLRRLAAGTDRLICSQLADLALQAGGIRVFRDDRPRGAVTPASFGRYFYERGWAAKA